MRTSQQNDRLKRSLYSRLNLVRLQALRCAGDTTPDLGEGGVGSISSTLSALPILTPACLLSLLLAKTEFRTTASTTT
jgi:hypothetical protein